MRRTETYCLSCVYWEFRGETGDGKGLCRRYPPAALSRPGAAADSQQAPAWPGTRPDDWCGEWAAADEEHGAGAAEESLDPDEDRWLRNVSTAQALLVLSAEKRERLLDAVLTPEEKESPAPPDDFHERVQRYFAEQREREAQEGVRE